MKRITKQEGTTPSERYLKSLCERSFLSLWSYPNVYRDQGRRGGIGAGKELCDLLVVFDDTIIIFSDKSCTFPNSGSIDVDWRRWYQRSVEKSADQVYGAERWIRDYPDRIFLDKQCTEPFPLELPTPASMKLHRIVVALGAGGRCREAHHSASGSLLFCPEVSSPTSPTSGALPSRPFVVGNALSRNGIIHVFDDTTLDTILTELDTISDFTHYLRTKEQLLLEDHIAFVAGEENLLAYYLAHPGRDGYHSIPANNEQPLLIGGELWPKYAGSSHYHERKDAIRHSYLWDQTIEMLSSNVLGGTTVHIRGRSRGTIAHERRIRALARSNRRVRGALALFVAQCLKTASSVHTTIRTAIVPAQPDTGYVLVLAPRENNESYLAYRSRRSWTLSSHCIVFKYHQRHLRHVVGIATEYENSEGHSEEVCYIDGVQWCAEDDAMAERFIQEDNVRIGATSRPIELLRDDAADAASAARRDRNQRKARRNRNTK
ncbi:hypothetical protein [Sorangium sp. So ce117]|uniref:hypothetical protein n=1 Tax=Sorangium sp. So ce117 TaxID=3133277 RepID=UPI003F63E848